MLAQVFMPTENMTEEKWLEARRAGVGGSDAAAIAGLSKWQTPMSVYLDKLGQASKDNSSSEAAYWGHVHEETVAREFSKRTGKKVRRRKAILQHPNYPFMLANVDRLIVGEQSGLECKTASEYLKDEWEGEEVPDAYLVQCQHYMAVTGFKVWWIAVLIGGNKFVYKKVERDEELIKYLIQVEKDFWENHVQNEIPPMFDGSEASTELLAHMYPVGFEDEKELPLAANELIERYKEAKVEEKKAKKQLKEAENQLKGMLGEYETGNAGKARVIWKTITATRFDTKTFAAKHPELFEKFNKVTTHRRFQVKEIKEDG
ncbi:YqaJ viral recombinase family protein [Bacillus sonorensis]|uniref:YqaJ viral recombinase family nuclease n=1 Tax=Bacillus sonorensis TaxID=119858 RepID=UPI0022814818|nr:YqaJ viral recombinase family protein [Bacillus sonorensis]MCY8269642.1 YqaJ viral recombinase family protein [Bacillus sonorensis]MCY8606598.1 YqaJ viral recombinase family protein [Bacillus sonorensis]